VLQRNGKQNRCVDADTYEPCSDYDDNEKKCWK